MTKEDYMRLPKERLAELLVEKDNEQQNIEPISSSGIANNTSIDTSNEQPYHP